MTRCLYPEPSLQNAAAYRNLRVGLFGGSFNPAHSAHQQLAQRALEALELDVVWWLVSPQNPLKSIDDMGAFASRMVSVQKQLIGTRMLATDIELQLGTQYTCETIRQLREHFPKTHFTWMMGADSFRQFHRWDHWQDIAQMVPMAVFARPPRQLRALSGFAAKTLQKYRVQSGKELARRTSEGLPGWVYVMMPLNPISATEIRSKHGRT
ncbi:MAG TPA: nicotinic acid mononucleotide adenylyltransferase [Rhodospirillaceae bacterium]|nr:nicotinic acid mononucleotide adenylyltransferase [Rhodospirillaceae bacterium]